MAAYFYVRCFNRYGWNYKDISFVHYSALKRLRALAKALGEKIEVEKMYL